MFGRAEHVFVFNPAVRRDDLLRFDVAGKARLTCGLWTVEPSHRIRGDGWLTIFVKVGKGKVVWDRVVTTIDIIPGVSKSRAPFLEQD
jgi:hypothetical protein